MGSQGSSSESKPLTAEERLASYKAGMSAINPSYASYQAPQMERISTDYNQLQNDLTEGYSAPIQRQQDLALQANDQAMSDRGIYTSKNALDLNNDVREAYAPQFANAGANAINARYGLQMQDITNANANKLAIANNQYESSWRPLDYRAGIWNGTGGVVSSSNSGGWSI